MAPKPKGKDSTPKPGVSNISPVSSRTRSQEQLEATQLAHRFATAHTPPRPSNSLFNLPTIFQNFLSPSIATTTNPSTTHQFSEFSLPNSVIMHEPQTQGATCSSADAEQTATTTATTTVTITTTAATTTMATTTTMAATITTTSHVTPQATSSLSTTQSQTPTRRANMQPSMLFTDEQLISVPREQQADLVWRSIPEDLKQMILDSNRPIRSLPQPNIQPLRMAPTPYPTNYHPLPPANHVPTENGYRSEQPQIGSRTPSSQGSSSQLPVNYSVYQGYPQQVMANPTTAVQGGASFPPPPPPGERYVAEPAYGPAAFQYYPPPTMTPIILPNFDTKDSFSDEPSESWQGFIEKWEIDMQTFGLDMTQLAQCLPKSLRGSAYQAYMSLAQTQGHVTRNYPLLKEELGKTFLRHKTMKGRSLFTLTQGRSSVGVFYDELITAGKAAYTSVPDEHKRVFLRDAFVNGLHQKYQDKIIAKGEVSLEKALDIAKQVEYDDTVGRGQKVVAANSQHRVNQVDTKNEDIEAMREEMKMLRDLVKNQAKAGQREKPYQTQGPANNGYNNYYTPQYGKETSPPTPPTTT